MKVMGFCDRWIRLVMMCVKIVQFQVLFGDEKIGPIVSTIGLRQGDPMSLYLFILGAEVLSSLIRKYEWEGHIPICQMSQATPKILHLFFIDGSYFFFRGRMEECEMVK